jgi:hypothetical protein
MGQLVLHHTQGQLASKSNAFKTDGIRAFDSFETYSGLNKKLHCQRPQKKGSPFCEGSNIIPDSVGVPSSVEEIYMLKRIGLDCVATRKRG